MNRPIVLLRSVVGRATVFLATALCVLACTQRERVATTLSTTPDSDQSTAYPLPAGSTPSQPAPWAHRMLLISDGDEEYWLVPEDVQTQARNDLARIRIALQLDLMLNPSSCPLSDYYLLPELASQQELAEERNRGNADVIVDGPGRMHRNTLLYCTPDGWECIFVDRVTGGTIQHYDSISGQLVDEYPGPSICQFIRVRYDDQDGCWKIAEYGESYEADAQECP